MLTAALALTVSLCVVLAPTSTFASPAASPSSHFPKSLMDRGHRVTGTESQAQSMHMRLADRLLKRVLDLTYDTLKDLGASEEDLSAVQHKRNYIQSCYFHAISCY